MNTQSSWSELSLEQLLDPTYLEAQLRALQAWLLGELLVASMVFQAVVIALAFLVARALAPRVRAWVERETRQRGLEGRLERGAAALAPLTLPVCWLIIQWLSVLVAANAGWPHHLIKTVVSLLTAWVIIRLSSSLVRDPVWSQAVAITAWTRCGGMSAILTSCRFSRSGVKNSLTSCGSRSTAAIICSARTSRISRTARRPKVTRMVRAGSRR